MRGNVELFSRGCEYRKVWRIGVVVVIYFICIKEEGDYRKGCMYSCEIFIFFLFLVLRAYIFILFFLDSVIFFLKRFMDLREKNWDLDVLGIRFYENFDLFFY